MKGYTVTELLVVMVIIMVLFSCVLSMGWWLRNRFEAGRHSKWGSHVEERESGLWRSLMDEDAGIGSAKWVEEEKRRHERHLKKLRESPGVQPDPGT